MRMTSSLRFTALLAAVLVAAGCSATVDGTAQPELSTVTPKSLTGHTIMRVLLGRSALSLIVKQPLEIDSSFPPSFGGPEILQGESSPPDCMGVAVMMEKGVYQSSNVRDVALETWRPHTMDAEVTRVKQGVVSFPTAADAEALFDKVSQQWQKCEGQTVPLSSGAFGLGIRVHDVQSATSVVAATISMDMGLPGAAEAGASIPAGRAFGVRGNCLIEVEVDYRKNQDLQGRGGAYTSALDIAQVMRDKVLALS
jgi:PknH-like extracellular domain